MEKIENKIRAFARDKDRQNQYLALMVVGSKKGRSAREIMTHIIAAALLDFHGIPTKPNG